MNLNIINIGHYRITDYGRGRYQMFNRRSDEVKDLSTYQFKRIVDDKSVAICEFVEKMK